MSMSPYDFAWNIQLGYKEVLKDDEVLVKERLLYHGRLGGDLNELDDSKPMFFYAEGSLSSVFSEHVFLNRPNACETFKAKDSEEEFVNAYLSQSPAVFPLKVTIDNPIILDMRLLLAIAEELGVSDSNRIEFVAEFEDSNSDIRNQVFTWAKQQGFDGAVIANDWTPEVAGGDSCYRTSYVAFKPRQQVRFLFENSAVQPGT